jgi:glyoxylate/succinic semialdehyde reductase
VLSTAGERTAFIDHSTIDEATGVRISKALTSKGARYLSAPVSGGWRDAAKGELLFICGGDRAVFDASTADGGAMAAMGERHWLVSESPAGAARAKLMLQIMMGSMIGALGETLALTKRADLDPTQIMEMFNASAMANPICAAKGKLMIEGKYDPNFQVYLQQKDLRLAMQLADDMGMPAPISAAVNAQYIAARQRGLADADFAAIHASYDPPTQREN